MYELLLIYLGMGLGLASSPDSTERLAKFIEKPGHRGLRLAGVFMVILWIIVTGPLLLVLGVAWAIGLVVWALAHRS